VISAKLKLVQAWIEIHQDELMADWELADDFSLDLRFDDGSFKRFDAKPHLKYEVFRELKDLNYFKQIRLVFGTVQWPHEQDISPETLYLESAAIPVSSRGNGS
jgi:hypothetical protein